MPSKISQRKNDIDRYFQEHPVPTVSGLARALGMERRRLVNYKGSDSRLRQALQRIEEFLETRAYGPQSTGFVFGLKNNFNWQDKPDEADKKGSRREASPFELLNDEKLAAFLMWDLEQKHKAAGGKSRRPRTPSEDELRTFMDVPNIPLKTGGGWQNG